MVTTPALSNHWRMIRVLVYEGPEAWLHLTLASSIHHVRYLPNGASIRVANTEIQAVPYPEHDEKLLNLIARLWDYRHTGNDDSYSEEHREILQSLGHSSPWWRR